MEPAFVVHDLEGALGVFVVAQHDIVAAHDNLALAGGGVHVVQADLHLIGGKADGTGGLVRVLDQEVGEQRGRLGEAIADGVREVAVLQELLHAYVQLGAADTEEDELAAEGLHHAPADEPVQDVRDVFIGPGKHAALLDGGKHAVFHHFLDDERHGAHDGGMHLLHGGEQDGGSGRLLKGIAGGSYIERVDGRNVHFIGMGCRKDGQETVLGPQRLCLEGGGEVRTDVAVAQHDALGLSGGSGRVDDAGEVVGVGIFYPAVALEVLVVFLDNVEGLDVDDQSKLLLALFTELGKKAL